MKITIDKSEVKGRLIVPSSKSYTIRGFICAGLAPGESRIIDPLASEDTGAAKGILTGLGAKIREEDNVWKVNGGNFTAPKSDLYSAESATTFRFMVAVAAAVPGRVKIVPGQGLAKRPITPLLEALSKLGVKSHLDENGAVTVEGGSFKGGETALPGNISSQYVSALLLAAPLSKNGVKITVTTPIESKPYILMTLECLNKFGINIASSEDLREFIVSPQAYKPASYQVEGDWSSASYLLALGAVLGETENFKLNPDSLQGDKVILKFLTEMGAGITVNNNSITVRKSKLQAIKANLKDAIDLLPTMGVLAAAAEGTTELAGIARARLKESNRVAAVKAGLESMGIQVTEEEDRLIVKGGTPKGGVINSRNDHRIAMSFSILGGVAGNTTILGAECVAKTFPEYWAMVKKAGLRVKTDDSQPG